MKRAIVLLLLFPCVGLIVAERMYGQTIARPHEFTTTPQFRLQPRLPISRVLPMLASRPPASASPDVAWVQCPSEAEMRSDVWLCPRKYLRDLTPLTLQQYFSSMTGSELSFESRDKIRDVMSSILASSVTYGLLVKNPMEGVRLSPGKKGKRVKPFIEPAKFVPLLALIPEPYATMVFVAVYTGLRASELIGLKWKNVHHDAITIEERFCRGEWGIPKSEASNATIPVNPGVIERIHWLRTFRVDAAFHLAIYIKVFAASRVPL